MRIKHRKLKYYKGADSISDEPKKYQVSPVKHLCQQKPGPSHIVSLEDEILIIKGSLHDLKYIKVNE